jgi:hypothetical protein
MVRQQPCHPLANPVRRRASTDEDLSGDAVTLVEQAEQDVLSADVAVAKLS